MKLAQIFPQYPVWLPNNIRCLRQWRTKLEHICWSVLSQLLVTRWSNWYLVSLTLTLIIYGCCFINFYSFIQSFIMYLTHFEYAVHQLLSGHAPSYLADDCCLVTDARPRRLCSADTCTLLVSWMWTDFQWPPCLQCSWNSLLLLLAVGEWPIPQPPRAEAFSRPSAQPVSTQPCVRVCVCVCIGTRPRCPHTHVHMRVLWAVFVQFILVRRPHCASRPQSTHTGRESVD